LQRYFILSFLYEQESSSCFFNRQSAIGNPQRSYPPITFILSPQGRGNFFQSAIDNVVIKSTEFPYCQIALLPNFYLLNPANFVNQAIWQSNKYISHFTLLIPHFIS